MRSCLLSGSAPDFYNRFPNLRFRKLKLNFISTVWTTFKRSYHEDGVSNVPYSPRFVDVEIRLFIDETRREIPDLESSRRPTTVDIRRSYLLDIRDKTSRKPPAGLR